MLAKYIPYHCYQSAITSINIYLTDQRTVSHQVEHTRSGRSKRCRTRTRGGQVQVARITNSYVQWTLKQNTLDTSDPDNTDSLGVSCSRWAITAGLQYAAHKRTWVGQGGVLKGRACVGSSGWHCAGWLKEGVVPESSTQKRAMCSMNNGPI